MTDADKRDRIIAAAYEVLSEKGYDKASTKEIASTAGVAQGLINYYFSSKDLLFAEVFRRQTINFCASFDDLIEPGGSELTPESILKLLGVSKNMAHEEQNWFRLRQELFAIGLRNDAARETLKDMLEMERRHISVKIAEISGLPRSFTDVFASISYSIFNGLSLQRVADATFEYDQAYAMVAEMFGAYYEKLSKKKES